MGYHEQWTAGLVGIATAALIVMAILIIVALDRVKKIKEDGNGETDNTRNADRNLIIAQVLAWIAAGLGLILVIGYIALHARWLETEWIHLVLWIGIFGCLIASGVFLFIALSDVDKLNKDEGRDKKAADNYIWGALIAGIVALAFLLISGGWRIAHLTNKTTGYYAATTGYGVPMQNYGYQEPAEMPPSSTGHRITVEGGENTRSVARAEQLPNK